MYLLLRSQIEESGFITFQNVWMAFEMLYAKTSHSIIYICLALKCFYKMCFFVSLPLKPWVSNNYVFSNVIYFRYTVFYILCICVLFFFQCCRCIFFFFLFLLFVFLHKTKHVIKFRFSKYSSSITTIIKVSWVKGLCKTCCINC